MSDKIVVIGYSGHSYVAIDAATSMGLKVTHYSDLNESIYNPYNLEYLGNEGDSNFQGWKDDYSFILGIGDNSIRYKAALKVLTNNKKLINVIHPSVSYSSNFEIGIGNFFSRQVSINTFAKIGNFCILNTGCIIEHECKLGDAVHIAPGAVLTGGVSVGDFSFIGANSVIKQGVKIGNNVIVGAGTVVLNDVADNKTIVGNPGRIYI